MRRFGAERETKMDEKTCKERARTRRVAEGRGRRLEEEEEEEEGPEIEASLPV